MAHLLLRFDGKEVNITKKKEGMKIINLDSRSQLGVYGKDGTYCYFSDEKDFIVSIGYVCHIESDSGLQTLSNILHSFNESQVCYLKKNLVGQFVIVLKKDQHIYVFSDFISSRNIFYSADNQMVSSSFALLESMLKTNTEDLDRGKIFEFFSLRYIIFPAWLGRSTQHKRIKWLLPYEYLKINLVDASFMVNSITYSIDNSKVLECSKLANDLVSVLRSIIDRKEFNDSLVAASLTGGRDTRLVAAIAADQYRRINYRIAISSGNFNSMQDLKVAGRVARKRGIQLDVYQFQPLRDEARFYEITEGLTPTYNHSITPLLESSQAYALGFGGAFGSQLFWPIRWTSINNFIDSTLEIAKRFVFVGNGFWDDLHDSLSEQFQVIKKTFSLNEKNDYDYIRLFQLLQTARYASFIMSAYNRGGYQLEPYGSYSALELALRVPPALWGNHKKIYGDCIVQTRAMALLNSKMARVITYSSFRPMVPLSRSTFPLYIFGCVQHYTHWLRKKFIRMKEQSFKTNLPEGSHISDGWDKPFIDRTVAKYGLMSNSEQI